MSLVGFTPALAEMRSGSRSVLIFFFRWVLGTFEFVEGRVRLVMIDLVVLLVSPKF
jgi:hypothetical protein